jgi:hypothetical protein
MVLPTIATQILESPSYIQSLMSSHRGVHFSQISTLPLPFIVLLWHTCFMCIEHWVFILVAVFTTSRLPVSSFLRPFFQLALIVTSFLILLY